MKENKTWSFWLYFGIWFQRQKKNKKGHLQGAAHIEVRKEEKERSWCLPESAPPPLFFIYHLQGKEKWAWFGAAAQHIRPPSFQAPFDEAGPGQEHRWLQGRGKTSVFMVEGVLSIWARPSNGGSAPGS